MPGIFERLNQELESFGKRAQVAVDEGRLQLERFRLKRERDEAATKLGYLTHQLERGRQVDQAEREAWLVRMDTLDQSITRVEREMAATKGEALTVNETPAPAGTPTGEAEVVKLKSTVPWGMNAEWRRKQLRRHCRDSTDPDQ